MVFSRKPRAMPQNSAVTPPKIQSIVMVRLNYSGGMCPEGPCGHIIEINSEGTLLQTSSSKDSKPAIKQIDQTRLDAFNTALSVVDFKKIKSKKFEGECPTNFDGQKIVYEFGTSSGETVSVDSCEFALDQKDPVFISIDNIVKYDVYGGI